MPDLLDWLFTIKEVCAMIFDVKFLKKMLLKMELTGPRTVTVLAQINFTTELSAKQI